MTDGLTSRQTQILKSLIDEYIGTADAVGSLALEKKYNLGISPATIRNEMVNLTSLGYLKQPHTSSGRVPTPKAMKFYISQLMEEKEMSLADEVKAKEEVWDSRNDFDKLMEDATESLADKTHSLAVAATDSGAVWRAGYPNIFDSPELNNLEVCRNVFSLLEETSRLHELLFERLTGLSLVEVLFGEELGWPFFEPVGVIATRFQVGNTSGAIGVIGPFGSNYSALIPTVKYYKKLIEEVAK